MIVEAVKLDVTQYTVQYELLRSQVIGLAGNAAPGDTAADQRRGVGLALFLSKGMPGWIETVETVLRATLTSGAVDAPDPAPHESSLPSSATAVCLAASVRHEVTTLLANLVLSTRSAVHQSSMEGYRSW
jgi:hypothetical protein